ncbi:RNA polymerase II holoenzyme cyclin-like subunit [Collariella sp. IMI 366227]|nr:RNA polymerase II holoenzyme cyclin-like subunit [Collariella sp. IMI 366227]
MAANYWESTQRKHWQFTKDELTTIRQRLDDEDPTLVQMFPLPQLRHLNIYFNQQILRLGKRLGVRQQAMATAQVYLKRFYTHIPIRLTNPYLVITTALYLACKMEECPQHIRLLTQEARSLWPSDLHAFDASRVGECEFSLISEMSSQMIVHQPYRTLLSVQEEFGLTHEEMSLAWTVVNDHYMTDLPLLHPPHVVALTAVLLALVLRPSSSAAAGAQARAAAMATGGAQGFGSQGSQQQQMGQSQNSQGESQGGEVKKVPVTDPRLAKVQRFAAWLADSSIDIEAMIDCTQELISFYDCHEQYNDKHTREQISRFIKARGLDK